MTLRVVVLGAGFGGLELSSMLSEALGDSLDLTLIDRNDSFIFGFSKLDVMFGHETPDAVRVPYRHIEKPGVRFRRETITAIDPEARRVTTNGGTYDADVLVVALGADYDVGATPGLAEGGNEFYSVAGAERLRDVIPTFSKGRAIVGVTSTPFKCPPAPSEAALLLHDYLTQRGIRDACEISLVMPFPVPIPPSPETSQALLAAFAERGITFVPRRLVRALDPARRVAILDDDTEMPYDLFLGVPKHVGPDVVAASGMTEDGWIPVNPMTLETRFPGVFAVGDVTSVGTPKAGVFSEGAARVVAAEIIAAVEKGEQPPGYDGRGFCYIEFGGGRVGNVEVQFLPGQPPTGQYYGASLALAAEKKEFGASRRARWFGLPEGASETADRTGKTR
ncbi:MAG: FAD-dependent oxidoreductase [Dehalococcoidia bacterium]